MTGKPGKSLSSGYSRLFLFRHGARIDRAAEYIASVVAGGIEQSLGSFSPITVPDSSVGRFRRTIGYAVGDTDMAKLTLTAQLFADTASDLARLSKERCPLDIHIHLGECTDPMDFNEYEKAYVLELGFIENFNTSDLGALTGGEQGQIRQSIDLAARNWYELNPMLFDERVQIADGDTWFSAVHICRTPVCGACQIGDLMFAGTSDDLSGTPPRLYYSIDAGETWDSIPLTLFGSGGRVEAIVCLGDYVVAFDTTVQDYAYIPLSQFDGYQTPVPTYVDGPNNPRGATTAGKTAWICQTTGRISRLDWDDITTGVFSLVYTQTGAVTLNEIRSASSQTIVAVGDSGAVVYSTDGGASWSETTLGGGATDFLAVECISDKHWIVGGAGTVYYTTNAGLTWTETPLVGLDPQPTSISKLVFGSRGRGWVAYNVTGSGRGFIGETNDGGHTWRTVYSQTFLSSSIAWQDMDAISGLPNRMLLVSRQGPIGGNVNGGLVVGED